jgi:hypothetical protein
MKRTPWTGKRRALVVPAFALKILNRPLYSGPSQSPLHRLCSLTCEWTRTLGQRFLVGSRRLKSIVGLFT